MSAVWQAYRMAETSIGASGLPYIGSVRGLNLTVIICKIPLSLFVDRL